MYVFIRGRSGTGKTYIANLIQNFLLQKGLRLPIISAGQLFRMQAQAMNQSLEAHAKFVAEHPEEELLIDSEIFHMLYNNSAIIESRVLPYLHDLKRLEGNVIILKIISRKQLRIERIQKRLDCSPEEACLTSIERDMQDRKRYRKIYQINVEQPIKGEFRVLNNYEGPIFIQMQLNKILKEYILPV